jgi:hypothetical protein
MRTIQRGVVVLALLTPLVLFAAGCGQGDNKQAQGGPATSQTAGPDSRKDQPAGKDARASKDKGEEEGKHEGWWCDEHGIPEAECSLCSKKAADAFKARGDWCDKHNRAKSQCFKCDPSLKEKFAARYRARYNGKEPPPITDDD